MSLVPPCHSQLIAHLRFHALFSPIRKELRRRRRTPDLLQHTHALGVAARPIPGVRSVIRRRRINAIIVRIRARQAGVVQVLGRDVHRVVLHAVRPVGRGCGVDFGRGRGGVLGEGVGVAARGAFQGWCSASGAGDGRREAGLHWEETVNDEVDEHKKEKNELEVLVNVLGGLREMSGESIRRMTSWKQLDKEVVIGRLFQWT
jgi:hypothetical protein